MFRGYLPRFNLQSEALRELEHAHKCKAVLIIVLGVSKYMKEIVVVAILGNMFGKGESGVGTAHKEAVITLIICDRSKFYMSNYSEKYL